MRSLHDRVLTLPDETVVIPGHGPRTTIGEERGREPVPGAVTFPKNGTCGDGALPCALSSGAKPRHYTSICIATSGEAPDFVERSEARPGPGLRAATSSAPVSLPKVRTWTRFSAPQESKA